MSDSVTVFVMLIEEILVAFGVDPQVIADALFFLDDLLRAFFRKLVWAPYPW